MKQYLIVLLVCAAVTAIVVAILVSFRLRRRMSQVLMELDNYSSIIDQANDAMLVLDIADGRIYQANPSAAELLGYTESELVKKSLFELHPPEFLDTSASRVADVWEQKGLIYNDIPFKTKNGTIVPVECSAKVAPFAGRPAIVIYARDIRERLRLEKEIGEQRRLIDEKNKDIKDSIEYSKRIQRSFLPEKDQMKLYAPESFIYFRPRDVVSGDFYWFINYQLNSDVVSESGNVFKQGSRILVIAAVDCTGHGVPGAFMSVIGNTLLNQTVRNRDIRSPAAALDYVNAGLKKNLNKNQEDQPLRDGMDIALCTVDMDGLLLEYAGANNPVYVVRGKELIVLESDKQALTASPDSEVRAFVNKSLPLQKGDSIYLFTDGYADQFGGPKEKKFLYKRFKELLISIQAETMENQKQILNDTFQKWKGRLDQVDDVLVIGIRIT